MLLPYLGEVLPQWDADPKTNKNIILQVNKSVFTFFSTLQGLVKYFIEVSHDLKTIVQFRSRVTSYMWYRVVV